MPGCGDRPPGGTWSLGARADSAQGPSWGVRVGSGWEPVPNRWTYRRGGMLQSFPGPPASAQLPEGRDRGAPVPTVLVTSLSGSRPLSTLPGGVRGQGPCFQGAAGVLQGGRRGQAWRKTAGQLGVPDPGVSARAPVQDHVHAARSRHRPGTPARPALNTVLRAQLGAAPACSAIVTARSALPTLRTARSSASTPSRSRPASPSPSPQTASCSS